MKTRIPTLLLAELQLDDRMYRCVVADEECSGRIEWHHAVMFAGRALQVGWAIHGICHGHHLIADRKDIRARIVKVIHKLGGKEVKEYEKIKKL